ncbi:lysophospholipase [Streptomyces sp. DH-12]|uniref:SGNH/GDSL hydrolase family protein n=1 Tax=Streptomyces sp. DH-12 TaxID=2072509 RepID=UPI000CCF3DD9|nr:SGNH/GDSL hydrolase family protein [Streptomyces sp. DH-12]PNV31165.1 lysophospholipase [Streptomyces sp. DH-12]
MPGTETTCLRHVALGDSQTEGVGDGDDVTGLRGFAEHPARHEPALRYANLAVRGRLTARIRTEQLPPAPALRPDLATVVAGVNGLLRPRFDADEVCAHLDAVFGALTEQGARVATVTVPDLSRVCPVARPLIPRVTALNEGIRRTARRHGVVVAEAALHPVAGDPRLGSPDRLHAGPLGRERIAAALAHALRLPGGDDTWTHPLPPQAPPTGLRAVGTELRWPTGFLGPWLLRRLRGRSSGDGRTARRPLLHPVLDDRRPVTDG